MAKDAEYVRHQKTIGGMIKALQSADEAFDLLVAIFGDIGGHTGGKLRPETLNRLNLFMEFDDGE